MAEGCLRRDNDSLIGVAANEPKRRYRQDGGDPHSRPRDGRLDRRSLGTDELRLRYSHSGADAEILAKAESFDVIDVKSPMATAISGRRRLAGLVGGMDTLPTTSPLPRRSRRDFDEGGEEIFDEAS